MYAARFSPVRNLNSTAWYEGSVLLNNENCWTDIKPNCSFKKKSVLHFKHIVLQV